MTYAERHRVSITTDADGDAIGYTPVVTGKIRSIIYIKTDYADGVDFTITGEASGQTIWTEENVNAAKTVSPGQPTHSTAGVAATYDGSNAVLAPVAIAGERVKIVVAAGGDTKAGAFDVIIA